jgi:hypothetical protein
VRQSFPCEVKEFPVDLRRTDKRAKSPPKSLIHGVSTYFG